MDKQKFDQVVDYLTDDRKSVSGSKRKDYTRGNEDVLKNFKNQADYLGMTPLQSLGVHMEKQFAAVMHYIKTDGQSESEPIIRRIGDVMNYMELLYGLLVDLGYEEDVRKTSLDELAEEWDYFSEEELENFPLDKSEKYTDFPMDGDYEGMVKKPPTFEQWKSDDTGETAYKNDVTIMFYYYETDNGIIYHTTLNEKDIQKLDKGCVYHVEDKGHFKFLMYHPDKDMYIFERI